MASAKLLLVLFDLRTNMDYSGLVTTLREFFHQQIADNIFFIRTDQSVKQVYADLRPYIHSQDALFVSEFRNTWLGHADTDTIDWITKRAS